MITLKQIDYALAVAKNLHFKKAADECFISPSTLSNAITELEAHLGVQIFERTNKKVLITTLGKEILAKAKLIKIEVNSINDLAQSYSNAQPISLGIIPTVSPYFLPLMLPKIEKKLPAINLKIEESQSNSLVQKVSDGELDIAILALPYDTGDLKCYKFWEEDFYWVSHAKDINAGKAEIKAAELEDAKLMLLADGHCLKDHILDACNITSKTSYSLKASSLNTLIQLVKGNMGTTLIPQMALKDLVSNQKNLYISHLNEPGPHREIALICRENYAGHENVMLLLDIFKDTFRKYI